MGKDKVIIITSALVVAVFIFFGSGRIRSLRAQIGERKEEVAKSDQRLEELRTLRESLELRRMTGKVLCVIPRVQDPVANKVLVARFLESFLQRQGFESEVRVENERPSKDFPAVVGVNEVPINVGMRDYASYTQVVNLLKEIRNFPFVIEVITIGGTEVPVPGVLRLQLKYYLPGGS
jgi:hypothetical protein